VQQALVPADYKQFGDDLGVPTRSLAEDLEILWGQALLHVRQGLTAFQDLVGGLSLPLGGKFGSESRGVHRGCEQEPSIDGSYAPPVLVC
jgi:hypothetical protein